MNLLKETIEVLKENKKGIEDVGWVGTRYSYMMWAEFEKIADYEYDSGYGGQEINDKLLVVGKDFWLERHEYDGSEWWEYKEQPQKPKNHEIVKLKYGMWDD
jgi:hypothetical protein